MTSLINQLRLNMLDVNSFQRVRTSYHNFEAFVEEPKKLDKNCNQVLGIQNIVNYEEYIQYCEANAVSQYNSNAGFTIVASASGTDGQNIRPVHIGKALETYLHFGEENTLPFIEVEV